MRHIKGNHGSIYPVIPKTSRLQVLMAVDIVTLIVTNEGRAREISQTKLKVGGEHWLRFRIK